jgi:hypothetical protein
VTSNLGCGIGFGGTGCEVRRLDEVDLTVVGLGTRRGDLSKEQR